MTAPPVDKVAPMEALKIMGPLWMVSSYVVMLTHETIRPEARVKE